eukprot:jgi/Psemu1/21434/gm1.21434_g
MPVIFILWKEIKLVGVPNHRSKPEHLIWWLYFSKSYPTNRDFHRMTKISYDTLMKHIKPLWEPLLEITYKKYVIPTMLANGEMTEEDNVVHQTVRQPDDYVCKSEKEAKKALAGGHESTNKRFKNFKATQQKFRHDYGNSMELTDPVVLVLAVAISFMMIAFRATILLLFDGTVFERNPVIFFVKADNQFPPIVIINCPIISLAAIMVQFKKCIAPRIDKLLSDPALNVIFTSAKLHDGYSSEKKIWMVVKELQNAFHFADIQSQPIPKPDTFFLVQVHLSTLDKNQSSLVVPRNYVLPGMGKGSLTYQR